MPLSSLRWRVPLVALVIGLSLLLATPPLDPDGEGPRTGKLKLGLDLQGGMHLVLRVLSEELPAAQREDAVERALEIIRNRVDQFGVAEPLIQRQGENRIVVQLPGISDRKRALDLIGRTALLTFRLVSEKGIGLSVSEAEVPGIDGSQVPVAPPPGTRWFLQKDSPPILLEDAVLLEGKNLTSAVVQYSTDWNEPVVAITFDSSGAKTFADITSRNVNRNLAMLLDDVVQSAPVIREPILGGEAQISGSFTLKEAHDLAIALRAGALPCPIRIEEERSVGPSLGKDSVDQGLKAMGLASILVVLFMLVYYLFGGFIANLALTLNILIILAALSYFKATLTMPGIAGIILTIGMAVDTNVLILERIREELRLGKAVNAAVATGYKRAFSAILDSNLTTLITALILYRLGTGPVRGFAVTLAIGIVASFFTGLFVTRVLTDIYVAWRKPSGMTFLSFLKGVPRINFLAMRKGFYVLSAALIAWALFLAFTGIKNRLGIDFSGGVLQEYRFQDPVDIQEIRSALTTVGLETAMIQKFGSDRDVVVRSGEGSEEKIQEVLRGTFKDNPHEGVRFEAVGPAIGQELRKKSLWAALFSLLSILIYLAFRFEFRYSCAAIVALFHDALVCLGAILFTQREISIPVLAAILTIIGYSVNDTIVTFDRVRENLKKKGKESYPEIVNLSINETLSRTLLTSFTVLLVVLALYALGGPVINDFAFTMLVGLISGTYSTIFVACPMVVDWPGKRKHRL